jgi:hypothetical protein
MGERISKDVRALWREKRSARWWRGMEPVTRHQPRRLSVWPVFYLFFLFLLPFFWCSNRRVGNHLSVCLTAQAEQAFTYWRRKNNVCRLSLSLLSGRLTFMWPFNGWSLSPSLYTLCVVVYSYLDSPRHTSVILFRF